VGYDGDLNYKVNVAGSSQNTRQILAADGITKIPFIQIFSEVSSIDAWNPVASIVFTSNTLPIVPVKQVPRNYTIVAQTDYRLAALLILLILFQILRSLLVLQISIDQRLVMFHKANTD
jgi:hypothetical protein